MKKYSSSELTLAALGIVFGDIGTSPLYAIRECFYGEYGITISHSNIYGVLSLIFWTLIIIVTIKYLIFILRADNNGEGGVLVLTSLIKPKPNSPVRNRWFLISIGIFGSALLYGDGMITPAISVLSASEGVKIITPVLKPYVIPITVFILACLFIFQRKGTAKLGFLFGPIIGVWFLSLASLGLWQIMKNPAILNAVNPVYGILFVTNNGIHGFLVLGAVFLVATGAEALYADIGHFGKKPIRIAWFTIVLPSLFLNYFGQGALLLSHPEASHHPFYSMVPSQALIPIVILATLATIIASQAVITGAFSLTQQAMNLDYLPRLKIVHTAAKHIGQIYIPVVNWILMFCSIGLVLGFGSSSNLAAAYGVAVTLTMVISTILFYVVIRENWKWGMIAATIPVAIFLVVDFSFFSANISKLLHGAWFPLIIAAIIFSLMKIWRKGNDNLAERIRSKALRLDEFANRIKFEEINRVKAQAVFLSRNADMVPHALMSNYKYNKVIHSETMVLNIKTESIPRVPNDEKIEYEKLLDGFYLVRARYGFMETPNLTNILYLVDEKGIEIDPEKVNYFIGRETLITDKDTGLQSIVSKIFYFMSRNAFSATEYFDIPVDRVLVIGQELEI